MKQTIYPQYIPTKVMFWPKLIKFVFQFFLVRMTQQKMCFSLRHILVSLQLFSLISTISTESSEAPLTLNELKEKYGQGNEINFCNYVFGWFWMGHSFQRILVSTTAEAVIESVMAKVWPAITSSMFKPMIQCRGKFFVFSSPCINRLKNKFKKLEERIEKNICQTKTKLYCHIYG